MKKVSLAILLASGLVAAENGGYVGFDIGNTKAKFTASSSSLGLSDSEKDDGGSQTLKLGNYLDENSRFYLFYQNINIDGGDALMTGAGYDYLLGAHPLKPFVGAMFGYGSISVNDTAVDVSGAVYGVQAGLNYLFNNNISAEAGYRYFASSMEDTVNISGYDVKFETDNIANWFFGVNYRF